MMDRDSANSANGGQAKLDPVVREALERAIAEHGSLRAFARSVPVMPSVVSRALRHGYYPGGRVLAAIGLVRVVRYEPLKIK